MFEFRADEVAAGGFDAVDGLNVIGVVCTRVYVLWELTSFTGNANSSSSLMGISTLASHHPLRSL